MLATSLFPLCLRCRLCIRGKVLKLTGENQPFVDWRFAMTWVESEA